MAESTTTRLGLPRWTAGTDTPNRAEFDTAFAQLEALGVAFLQGAAADRPAAGPAHTGYFYVVTSGDRSGEVSYCNGSTWIVVVPATAAGGAGSTVGEVKMTAAAGAPTGWLLCQGQAVSRTTYSALFAAIGTTYGTGDGSTTFNLPDLRGRMPIGAGTLGGDTYNRGAVGGSARHQLSAAEMPSHTHSGPSHTHSGPSHSHSGPSHTHEKGTIVTGSGGAHTHTQRGLDKEPGAQGSGYLRSLVRWIPGVPFTADSGVVTTATDGAHTHAVSGSTAASGTGNTGASGTGATGASGTGNTGAAGSGSSHENRPPYLSLNYIIFAGA